VLERSNESVLGDLFGQSNVTKEADEPGGELGLLDPPDRLD
jgi:hypothetical protein